MATSPDDLARAAATYLAALSGADADTIDASAELGDTLSDALDTLVTVLDRGSEDEDAFALLDLEDDPYPGLAVGDSSAPWRLQWAIQLAELEAVTFAGMEDTLFLIDTHQDPSGRYRVYTQTSGARGDIEFAGIPEALSWMAARLSHERGAITDKALAKAENDFAAVLDDDWEDGDASGWNAFESALDAPLPEAWDAFSRGQWPVAEPVLDARPGLEGPGAQRMFTGWILRRFFETRQVELPKGFDLDTLEAPHRALVEHLMGFAEAMHLGGLPDAINACLEGDDEILQELAEAWKTRYESWRADGDTPLAQESDDDEDDDDLGLGDLDDDLSDMSDDDLGATLRALLGGGPKEPEPEPEDVEMTPFNRQLLAALGTILDDMVGKELVEIEEERKEPLLRELVRAASNARSPNHMLSSITRALVDSEQIEEIYASDDEIERALRAGLGG